MLLLLFEYYSHGVMRSEQSGVSVKHGVGQWLLALIVMVFFLGVIIGCIFYVDPADFCGQ